MKKAFTLAETLIVMGIIGVVAALTLPNLNSSTGDKEKVARVKKIYQNLTDAFGRARAVYGPIKDWPSATDCDNSQDACIKYDRLTDFLKITKDNFHGGRFYFVNGESGKWDDLGIYNGYILADGSVLYAANNNLIVDIDGDNNGPRTFGKDVFVFTFDKDNDYELIPDGDNSTCFSSGNCTKWVVLNDNMDYLKADNTGKCKNNNSITLDGTTNVTCK